MLADLDLHAGPHHWGLVRATMWLDLIVNYWKVVPWMYIIISSYKSRVHFYSSIVHNIYILTFLILTPFIWSAYSSSSLRTPEPASPSCAHLIQWASLTTFKRGMPFRYKPKSPKYGRWFKRRLDTRQNLPPFVPNPLQPPVPLSHRKIE